MLAGRFGELGPDVLARLESASAETLERLLERAGTARTLEELSTG